MVEPPNIQILVTLPASGGGVVGRGPLALEIEVNGVGVIPHRFPFPELPINKINAEGDDQRRRENFQHDPRKPGES